MADRRISSTKLLSRLVYVPSSSPRGVQSMLSLSKGGIFIGISGDFGRPQFINFGFLVNPHIFIVGMTGSGKSYLMRSLMLRLHAVIESKVVMVDFTGEYRETAVMLGAGPSSADCASELDKKGISYADLSGMDEGAKIAAANRILEGIVCHIRKNPGGPRQIFVILDEAWKIMKSGGPLESLLREGRKYGVGIIFASQLMEDIELAKLANVATIFIFRTQNKQSLDRLKRNYNLGDHLVKKMQNLDVGSCIMIQLYRSEKRDVSVIGRVLGIDLQKPMSIDVGDGMTMEIDRAAFEGRMKKLAEGRDTTGILRHVNESKGIELHRLIGELVRLGIDRNRILSALRSMRISDYDITDAFARAIDEIEAEEVDKSQ